MRGDGFVYQRGKRWWICYYREGTMFREPCGKDITTKKTAKDALKKIHTDLRSGTYLTPQERNVTVGELLDDLLLHLTNTGRKYATKAGSQMKAVRKVLGHVKASSLATADVERYQRQRLDAKKARATVNRECDLLRQAFRRDCAVRPRRVSDVPLIPHLHVDNTRQGFLSRADFEALAAKVADSDVLDFLEWFWWTGMRPNEIRQLAWSMFDAESWTLTLDPKAAKIGKGRVIALEGPLRAIVKRRLSARRLDTTLMFHRVSKGRPGQPVRDFRRLWKATLTSANLPAGLLPYDLRRSAVRNLIRAGVHETVAMKISGHRTRSTFDRYNIASVEDLRDAVQKVTAYVEAQPIERNVASIEDSQNTHSRAQRSKAR